MKTKLQIFSIALTGLFLASCSSSMYMSKTSVTPSDDIYYTPSKTTSTITTSENPTSLNSQNQDPSKLNLAKLEKKYSDVLASDTTNNIDTLVYKAESTNPYSSILSDSYQDSYERRLRGSQDRRYGMENFTTYYSNAYWYASAFDPMFYNVVVMGSQVWVEPWYISSMFSWPHNHFRLGFGFGLYDLNWNPWAFNSYYNPYYGYNNWYGGDPYYWNNYYTNNYTGNYNNNNNSYYGRRMGGSTTNTALNIRSGNSYENQILSTRRGNGASSESLGRRESVNNSNIRTRNTNQSSIGTGNGQRNGNQEVISRNNRAGNQNITRLRNEGTYRNIDRTEQTRRNNESGSQGNSNIQRPRSTNNNDYIRPGTRNQNVNSGSNSRNGNTRNTSPVVREGRNSTPTYNSPNRVGTSTTRERPTSSGTSGHESTYSRPSSSSSSSGANTSSSSSGSSNNSSSGSGERRR